jgi:protein-S-isoprenylcysteine O-methyltransferase Ste14
MVVIGGGWSIGSCLHEVKGCVSRYSRRNRPTTVDRAAGIAARSGTRLVSSPFMLRGLFGFWTRVVFGGILIAGGLILASLAIRNFRQAATNVEPWKPSVTLVTTGIYGLMRNPMYTAMMVFIAGIAIALGSDWTLVLVVPAALILHFGVVKREERYLEAKFGDSYREYTRRVPRYWM